MTTRTASLERKTRETDIKVSVIWMEQAYRTSRPASDF